MEESFLFFLGHIRIDLNFYLEPRKSGPIFHAFSQEGFHIDFALHLNLHPPERDFLLVGHNPPDRGNASGQGEEEIIQGGRAPESSPPPERGWST